MSLEGQKFFPGDEASPQQVLELAEEYRRAALTLLPIGRRRKPLSRAPFRLAAIHAIELFLTAFLLHSGEQWNALKKMRHDLGKRSKIAKDRGLILRKGTADHLQELTATGEYLISRYDPSQTVTSPLSRLKATLDDVSKKVTVAFDRK